MGKFVTTPEAEILGVSIQAYIRSLMYDDIKHLLIEYDLQDIEPRKWYPFQLILNVLRDIHQDPTNTTEKLVSVGMKIAELVPVAEGVNSVFSFLESFQVGYLKQHRNITEAGWSVQLIEPEHLQVTYDGPYPDDMCYGIVWGAFKRFRTPKTQFTVTIENKENDNAPTVFDATWTE